VTRVENLHQFQVFAESLMFLLAKVAPCFVALRCEEKVRKNVFNLALLRHENVEWKQAEVETTPHCGIKNCERYRVEVSVAMLLVSRLDIHLQETGGIVFLQLPDLLQGVIPCPLDISLIS
jgi:hypothetical protein